MAKKVLLKNNEGIELIPITRGELVLDSSGKQALHSREFLATDTQPGLTTIHYVTVSKEDVNTTPARNVQIVNLKSSSDVIHPITTSDAVIVTTDSGSDSLTNVLREIRVEVNDSKVILDERPTEGNTTHSVSSDGIFQELKETVGNIQILLQNV